MRFRRAVSLLLFLWCKALFIHLLVICFDFNFLQTAEKVTDRETPTGIFIKKEVIQKSPG